ncbi:tetratricopeptide repeat protein [Aequorivita marina]|uniref:tetratricopeptide repeat protein n=1 Tax=Aequorivita marina TaxID=3073654 RepID=UPI002875279B|nr:hypothetical protein [Aequorivita sp. S2608]MDS1297224.1 hypothetical protein [Aequorivita sp. S2608]
MFLRIIFILLFLQMASAQEQLPALLDSLAQTNSNIEKSRLSLKIASQLASTDWERSLGYMDVAKTNALRSGSDKVIADYYIGLAEIYQAKDALDISLEHYIKAYGYYESLPVSKARYKLENSLAIAYARTANQENALHYFQKIYRYDETKKDSTTRATLLNNMGRVWMDKNLDSSLYYFNRSLELTNGNESHNLGVFLYTNLGRCYVQKNDLTCAKKYFNQALNEIDTTAYNSNVAWVYNELSEFYIKENKIDSSSFYARKAVKILDSIAPFGFEQYRAVGLLYKSYLDEENFESASSYFEKYLAISDSLNLEDKRVNVERLLIEEEYKNKEKIRELEDSKRRANNYILFLALLALLLFLGSLVYRYHNKLKRAKLEKQLVTAKQKELSANLQLKNKELVGKAMIEMHRTEIIEDILKDLKEVKLKAAKKETQKAIDYIAKRLKRNTSSDIWEEFELRFEQVHESFYKNLLTNHPGLTPREKRLCALLKLNLTSKEIAQITGQTPKSIENARTRLRKKLNITNSQTDLSAYLSSFD